MVVGLFFPALVWRASRIGDLKAFMGGIEKHPDDIFSVALKKKSILHVLAKNGHVALIRALPGAISSHCSQGKKFLQFYQESRNGEDIPTSPWHMLVDFPNRRGETALMLAAKHGHQECVRALLELGADPYLGDVKNKDTAMHLATKRGHDLCLRALLESGRTSPRALWAPNKPNTRLVDVQNSSGFTCLHLAVAKSDVNAVEVLLKFDPALTRTTVRPCCDAWGTYPPGTRPMHIAAKVGNTSIVLLVLRHSLENGIPDPRLVTDCNGVQPYMQAAISGNWHLASILLPSSPLSSFFSQTSVSAAALIADASRSPGMGVLPLASIACSAWIQHLHLRISKAESHMLGEENARVMTKLSIGVAQQHSVMGTCMQPLESHVTGVAPADTSSADLTSSSALPDLGHNSCSSAPVADTSCDPVCSSPTDLHPHPCAAADMDTAASDDGMCGVCFDKREELRLHGCKHSMCIRCSQKTCSMYAPWSRPPACPFCQQTIKGFLPTSVGIAMRVWVGE